MPRRKHKRARSLTKILDKRRDAEADITFRPYVRPFGNRGLAYVSRRGVDGEVLVANAQGITFQPGTIVPVGSNTGRPGEVIIGVPPPGSKGSAPAIKTSKTVAGPPTPEISGSFYNLYRSGGTSYLALYEISGGAASYVTDSHSFTGTGPTNANQKFWIPTDPFGHVADNSLFILDGTSGYVWDLSAGTIHDLNFTGSPLGVVFLNGWVYYGTRTADSSRRLYRTRCNGTTDGTTPGVSMIGEKTTDLGFPGGNPCEWHATTTNYYIFQKMDVDDVALFTKFDYTGSIISTGLKPTDGELLYHINAARSTPYSLYYPAQWDPANGGVLVLETHWNGDGSNGLIGISESETGFSRVFGADYAVGADTAANLRAGVSQDGFTVGYFRDTFKYVLLSGGPYSQDLLFGDWGNTLDNVAFPDPTPPPSSGHPDVEDSIPI